MEIPMTNPTRRLGLAAMLVLGLMAGASGRAEASPITMTYSGMDTRFLPWVPFTSQGGGSFSFEGSPASVTLADLSSFNFTETTDQPGIRASGTYAFGLADLRSFSATFGQGGQITGLSFATKDVATSDPYSIFGSEGFLLTSLAAGNAYTVDRIGEILTTGTLTIPLAVVPPVSLPPPAATPEPTSLALWGIAGLAGVGYARRHRKAATA
jgi:hypothetical protein